mmetsp:Transcript_115366/g.230004  ORF Transcript_115366/g.230004 Transcript_115366/m.230004 type:complete len:430 (+) Transcript_115366:53-1342(+)
MLCREGFFQTDRQQSTSQNKEERELYLIVDDRAEGFQPTCSAWIHMADISSTWRQRLAVCSMVVLSVIVLAFWLVIANRTSAAEAPKVMAKQRMFEQSHGLRPTSHAEMPGIPKFVKGKGSDDLCPYATVALTEEECRKVPEHFGGYRNSPFVITSPDDPHGCFGFGKLFYFNMHPLGSRRPGRQVYCKRFHGFLRFQKLANGQCVDYGFQMISSRDTCEAAALELQLTVSEPRVHIGNNSDGCHFLANLKTGSGSLWLHTERDSQGDVTRNSRDPFRMWQPLCMAQTTSRPPPLAPTTTTSTMERSLRSHRPRHRISQRSFVPGQVGSNSCPHGMVPLNELDCRELPGHFGGHLHHPLVIDSPGDPQGCFFFLKWYYFNVHPHGAAVKGRTPYCKSPVRLASNAPQISAGLEPARGEGDIFPRGKTSV